MQDLSKIEAQYLQASDTYVDKGESIKDSVDGWTIYRLAWNASVAIAKGDTKKADALLEKILTECREE